MSTADAGEVLAEQPYRAILLHSGRDAVELARLRADRAVTVVDCAPRLRTELASLLPRPTRTARAEPECWAWYPWRRTLISILGPAAFRRLRLDRNRNKITSAEQHTFTRLTVGIVGLSVGHSIAHTLALEGLCGRLRLADNDVIELTNLNRIPATVFDIGTNKAVVVARRIAELDPYLPTEVYPAGLTEATMDEFFDGLDLVIEECDSLDMKVRVREEARSRAIPVLMETSDRGLFDVERFDQDPHRPLFHGLLGDVQPDTLRGLSTHDKGPHVMRILQTAHLSARMAASMVEIDQTLSTWPQLGGDVQLGGATVAAAVRRFGRSEPLSSGRIRIDVDAALDGLSAVLPGAVRAEPVPPAGLHQQVPSSPLEAVVQAIRLAPSGGNSQPWSVQPTDTGLEVRLAAERTSAMDVAYRGSYVSIGAAAFNARVAAARHHLRVAVTAFPRSTEPDLVLSITLTAGEDRELSALYPAMMHRITNRNVGPRIRLSPELAPALAHEVGLEGACLHLVASDDGLASVGQILARSDRIRFLTPVLHRQMMNEMIWSEPARSTPGLEVETLGLDASDLAKLAVSTRAEVMALLAGWDGGAALGDNTRDRINASSAVAVVTVQGDDPGDYLRAGAAVERLWIQAERHQLGVQPISPVFLYARSPADRRALSEPFADELSTLQQRFCDVVGLHAGEVPALVLRLSHDVPPPAVRSRRLDRSVVVQP